MTDLTRLRVTVLLFHPFSTRSRINRAVKQGIVGGCKDIAVRDMYELYPDFRIDIAREHATLENSDVVVFQHPFYWYSCPALMKEWLDKVLEKGWAYGPNGDKLNGKYWLQIISAGGAEEAYHRSGFNQFSMPELLRPFERTARICGMIPLKPILIHGANQHTESSLAEVVTQVQQVLLSAAQGELRPEHSTVASPEAL